MKNLICSVIIHFIFTTGSAQQNLVINPSFETKTSCPITESQLSFATPWFDAGTGTPDYYNTCGISMDVSIPKNRFGHQSPHTGNAYVGIFISDGLEYREYIEAPLSGTLIAGTKYFFSFYASLADTFTYSSSSIGVYLSTNSLAVNHYSPIPVLQQIQNASGNFFDSFSWKKIMGSFVAVGGERYVTLGNFNTGANSPSIAVNSNQFPYNTARIYLYIDDLCLSTDSLCNQTFTTTSSISHLNNNEVEIFPNPCSEFLQINTDSPIQAVSLTLPNGVQIQLSIKSGMHSLVLPLRNFQNGLYYLSVYSDNGVFGKKILINH